MLGLNLQNYWTTSMYGTNDDANAFLVRGVLPHKTGGLPQIARITLPYQSVPVPGGNNVNGMGDINLFDIFLLKPVKGIEFGIGPYFSFPTATRMETGVDKWQAGLSGIVIKPSATGLLGTLMTYQHDFAGPSERPTQNIGTIQPFVIYNLPKTFYLRSTAIMNFNMQNGAYSIPVGVGAGKVWTLKSGTILNLFAEPQWTVAHSGVGVPKFQLFAGLNLQFPIGK